MAAPTTSALDSKREKSAAANAAAEKAKTGVADLDTRLQTNASRTKEQKQALRNAEAEANRLKRVLKNAAKERDRLVKDRKLAVSRVAKAEARAKAAEGKYDKAVLADLVRREKERDRAAAAPKPDPAPKADPPPERPSSAATTAVRTAARRTAAKAGTRAPRGRAAS